MARRSGGDASWWSAGAQRARPQDLPSWARRHLDEADETGGELAPSPSAPAPTPPRHRRAAAAAPAGSRLRGWGLAAACLAAAATSVPLALSTLAKSDDAYALPRVGTFPVVAPGDLPGGPTREPGSRPEATGSTGGQSGVPTGPDAAAALPPLAAPAVEVAPRRTVTIGPQAVTRPERTGTTTTSRGADDDDTPTTTTRTPRDTDGGGSPDASGSSGSAGPSSGTTSSGTPSRTSGASSDDGPSSRPSAQGGIGADVEVAGVGVSVRVR